MGVIMYKAPVSSSLPRKWGVMKEMGHVAQLGCVQVSKSN